MWHFEPQQKVLSRTKMVRPKNRGAFFGVFFEGWAASQETLKDDG